ncbi:MAG: metal ABC transporter substrate-binding protein [bacterium]
MNRKIAIVVSIVVVVAAASTAYAFGKLKVVASIPSLASITEMVGGDNVDVSSITRGSQDAHYIEAKPSYMVKLSRADLLVYSGMELEIGWLPVLIKGARNSKVAVGSEGHLNASQVLSEEERLGKPSGEVDRSMGDVHPSGNPHYLLNPDHGLKAGELIAGRLSELDPENKDSYRKNCREFKSMMERKISEWEERASVLEGKKVVCYHPHWSYLLHWLGMENAGYVEAKPGIPPTARHSRKVINMIKDKGIKVVIVSSWKEPSKARKVADSAGAELIILPGEVGAMEGSEDYVKWIEFMVDTLVESPLGKEE